MNRSGVFDRMRGDHRVVLKRVESLERDVLAKGRDRANAASRAPDDNVRELVALLERQFATHMAAEDEVLFPALAGVLPHGETTMEPLRAEHEELRTMLRRLARALREPPGRARDEQIAVQVRDLVDLLRIHIRKEESIVLNVAERVLSRREIDELESRLRNVETPRGATLPALRNQGGKT